MAPPRLTAADFPREVLTLFDQYVHGAIDRRGFIGRCAVVVGSAATASAMLDLLRPDFARAQIVAPGDTRIATGKVAIPSSEGSGSIDAYVAKPADASPQAKK